MKLFTFRDGGVSRLGCQTSNGVVDVTAALGMDAAEFFRGGIEAANRVRVRLAAGVDSAHHRSIEGLDIRPCVPAPGKILCVGLNYRQHAIESGAAIPETPVLFSKFANSLAAPGETIPLPAVATQYDYEVELGFVIGRRAQNVPEGEALSYVLGYCTANDLSARDLQTRTSQWLLGKTLDKFLPLGPYLVTSDEVPDPQALQLRTWVNGELRQDSSTADMIFSVAEIVSYASRYLTLESGDLVITGTPPGVALGKPEPKPWLVAGDEVTVEVEGLGRLTNTLISPTASRVP